MRKILVCLFFYGLLLAMGVYTLLMPGHLANNQPLFLRNLSFWMIIIGSLWVVKSTFFTMLAPWYTFHWTSRKTAFAHRHYRPLVSVIIPAWNEEVGLVSTVKTILASSYRPLEIVVVNDGSTDRSDFIMRTFLQKYQQMVGGTRNYAPIIYHYQPNGGKGAALNTGLALAHGELILTFDADSVIHKDAVKHFVSYFADPQVMAAAGNIKIGNTRTMLGLMQTLEYALGFQIKKAEALLGIVFVIGGAASAFRREVFQKLGGYHTGTLTEDLDLSLRIQEAGMKIVYVPEAIVHTEGPTTLRGLFKQRLRWKRGRIEALSMHKASFFHPKKGSNKLFFRIIVPLVILGDIETVLGTLYALLLYAYSIMAHDFVFLLVTMAITSIIFALQMSEDRSFWALSQVLILPIAWFFLQGVSWIEFDSLVRALYTFYRKREVKWQKWQRTGVADS